MPDMDKTFSVPQNVRAAAKRGIEARREHGRGGLDAKQAKKEGVGSGVQRASNLMQGSVSYKTVKRMLAFFNRHKAFKEHHSDPTSAAKISWDLWGGDAGFAWAKRIVKQEEKVDKGGFASLILGLDDEPVFDEPIGGEPIGGEPVLSFTELLKAKRRSFTELAEEAQETSEMLDDEGELPELTEAEAKKLHEDDPMIIPVQPDDKRGAADEDEDEDEEKVSKGGEDDDEDYDETLDAIANEIEYQPHLRLDHLRLNPLIKKAMKMRSSLSKGNGTAKRIALALRREQYTNINFTSLEGLLDGLGGDDPDGQILAQMVGGHLIIEAMEKSKPHVPAKYLDGLTGAARAKRKKQIQDRIKGKQSYKEMEGDDKVKTKPSKYSKTKFAAAVREEIKSSGKDEFIRAAAKISGVSRSIIEQVYDRGMKAWSTSGHRVGASAQAWAKARVYSFCTGGTTRKTADKDLWDKHSK